MNNTEVNNTTLNDTKDKNVTIKPIYDITFKNLFGKNGNEDILIAFLNQILKRNKNNEIISLHYANTEIVSTTTTKLSNSEEKNEKKKKNKRGRPRTKKNQDYYFSKSSNLDILSDVISKYNSTTNNNGTKISNNEDIENNENNEGNDDEDNDDEDNDDEDNDDEDNNVLDDHDIIANNNINENFEFYYFFKSFLNIELDKLIESFNKQYNKICKTYIEILNDDSISLNLKKKINNILNKNETEQNKSNELNENFNIENIKIKDEIEKFKDSMCNLFKPMEDDKIIKMKATAKNEERINIEIQVNEDPDMFKRSLYYAAGVIRQSLNRGEEYHKLPKIIMINILNFNLLDNTEKEKSIPHWDFTLKDKNTNEEKGFKDSLNIHFFELRKYKEYTEKHRTEMINDYPWIVFLNDPNDEYFKQDGIPKEFIKAREKLIYLQDDKEFKELYDLRIKQIMDEKSKMQGKLREGLEKGEKIGLEKGEKIGLEKGEKIGEKKSDLKHLLKSLKNNEILEEIKKEYETFTEEEFEEINNFVKDESYKISDLAYYLNMDENVVLEICEKYNLAGQDRRVKKQKSK